MSKTAEPRTEQAKSQQRLIPKSSLERDQPEVEQTTPADALQRIKKSPRGVVRPADILSLQQTIGNQAVRRLLASRPSPSAAGSGATSQPEIQRVIIPILPPHKEDMSDEELQDRRDISKGAERLHSKGTRGAIVRPEDVEDSGKPLAKIQEHIFIHAHGEPGALGGKNATQLKTWLEELGLSKDFSQVIVLAGCNTAKNTWAGFGRSLAKELFDLLVADGYTKLAVQGMAQTMVVHKGEIRVVQDEEGYDAAIAEVKKAHEEKQQKEGLDELYKSMKVEDSRKAKEIKERLEAEYEEALDKVILKYTHISKGRVTLVAKDHVIQD